jgi:hypothetical protein
MKWIVSGLLLAGVAMILAWVWNDTKRFREIAFGCDCGKC